MAGIGEKAKTKRYINSNLKTPDNGKFKSVYWSCDKLLKHCGFDWGREFMVSEFNKRHIKSFRNINKRNKDIALRAEGKELESPVLAPPRISSGKQEKENEKGDRTNENPAFGKAVSNAVKMECVTDGLRKLLLCICINFLTLSSTGAQN
ncbi:hypothetical protein CEXT_766881 [Caerostris extrusa]|uniref:Uncharacterized protein n=1 Tax=Caerostris extrusa TaxID=172846 RepID=A0AAV4Y2K6_CAEEX|nr:hypothetical protein CEXT_766881 [Caerostris extrusa]